jgi:hypothetical protein
MTLAEQQQQQTETYAASQHTIANSAYTMLLPTYDPRADGDAMRDFQRCKAAPRSETINKRRAGSLLASGHQRLAVTKVKQGAS